LDWGKSIAEWRQGWGALVSGRETVDYGVRGRGREKGLRARGRGFWCRE